MLLSAKKNAGAGRIKPKAKSKPLARAKKGGAKIAQLVKSAGARIAKAGTKPKARPKALRPVPNRQHVAGAVLERLTRAMPEPRCELLHRNAFELLIATILSAQSTDRMVNKVTPELFARYPTPAALAAADPAELELLIRPTGFFRNKAKALRAASQRLVDAFEGTVPKTMEEITTLNGVARKTGNVVLGTAYRITTGITVDTHAGRVARRLGLTAHEDPLKVERDLCDVFPKDTWIDMGHRLVLHGRYVCLAKKPRCLDCPLNEVCRSAEAKPEGSWTDRAQRERDLVEASFPAA